MFSGAHANLTHALIGVPTKLAVVNSTTTVAERKRSGRRNKIPDLILEKKYFLILDDILLKKWSNKGLIFWFIFVLLKHNITAKTVGVTGI